MRRPLHPLRQLRPLAVGPLGLLLALLLGLALAGCSSSDEVERHSTDEATQATDSIAAYLSEGHGLLDRTTARCVSSALISRVGVTSLQSDGFLTEDLTVVDQENSVVATPFADAWLACSTLGTWVTRGDDASVAECVDQQVTGAAARNFLLADLGATEANLGQARVSADAVELCRSGEQG